MIIIIIQTILPPLQMYSCLSWCRLLQATVLLIDFTSSHRRSRANTNFGRGVKRSEVRGRVPNWQLSFRLLWQILSLPHPSRRKFTLRGGGQMRSVSINFQVFDIKKKLCRKISANMCGCISFYFSTSLCLKCRNTIKHI